MTDFGPLIANPKSLLLGAAAQLGIFMTYVGCRLHAAFTGAEASSIGIIGGADGPTAIFVTAMSGPGPAGPHRRVCLLLHGAGSRDPAAHHEAADHQGRASDRHEAPASGQPSKEKILFPIVVTVFVALLVPSAAPLMACLMLGNLFKECGVRGSPEQDRPERTDEHRHHLPGHLRGLPPPPPTPSCPPRPWSSWPWASWPSASAPPAACSWPRS